MVVTRERTLSVWNGRLKMRVKVGGHGRPVVYLHPAGGLRWDSFLDTLATQYTVYAPEFPGTSAGDPSAIEQVDTLWDVILIYHELFQELGLAAPAVVGQSFGGMLACEVAACFPDSVGRLVLFAPVGLWREDAPVTNWIAAAPRDLPAILFHDPKCKPAVQFFTPPEDPEAAVLAMAGLIWALGCTGKFVWPLPDKGLAKRLHRVKAPTLIVWGRQDRLIPSLYAKEFGQRIANSRIEILDDCGHIPQLEQEEATTRLTLGFLSG